MGISLATQKVGGDRKGKSKNHSANLQNDPPVSQSQAAAKMNVSTRSEAAAKTVLDEGGPGLVAAVATDRKSKDHSANLPNDQPMSQSKLCKFAEYSIGDPKR